MVKQVERAETPGEAAQRRWRRAVLEVEKAVLEVQFANRNLEEATELYLPYLAAAAAAEQEAKR